MGGEAWGHLSPEGGHCRRGIRWGVAAVSGAVAVAVEAATAVEAAAAAAAVETATTLARILIAAATTTVAVMRGSIYGVRHLFAVLCRYVRRHPRYRRPHCARTGTTGTGRMEGGGRWRWGAAERRSRG